MCLRDNDMKWNKFLNEVGGKEERVFCYKGKDALEAVKQNGDALQYVDKSVFGEEN